MILLTLVMGVILAALCFGSVLYALYFAYMSKRFMRYIYLLLAAAIMAGFWQPIYQDMLMSKLLGVVLFILVAICLVKQRKHRLIMLPPLMLAVFLYAGFLFV